MSLKPIYQNLIRTTSLYFSKSECSKSRMEN